MVTNNYQKMIGTSFEIERVFSAPCNRVWAAWSEADQLAQWWGPSGCSVAALLLQFRAGGFFHYSMKFENAPMTWGRFNYREIVPQERIVWLNSFANEKCGIARAPFSDVCPLEIENTATFSERAGVTTVTVHAEPFGANDEEVNFFAELCSSGSIKQGFGGTFDQLARYLEQNVNRG